MNRDYQEAMAEKEVKGNGEEGREEGEGKEAMAIDQGWQSRRTKADNSNFISNFEKLMTTRWPID